MNNEHRLVFDDVLADGDDDDPSVALVARTSLVHADFLANAQQLAFHMKIACAGGLGEGPFLSIELSGDGRQWKAKDEDPIVLQSAGDGDDIVHYVGGEPWPAKPNARFARLRIEIGNKGNPYNAWIQIHATARTRRSVHRERVERPVARAPSAARRPGVQLSTLEETARLLAAADTQGPDAHAAVAAQLSTAARAELEGVVRAARSLSNTQRHALLVTALARSMAKDGAGDGGGCAGGCGGA